MVEDDGDWGERALCRTAHPDELFVEGAAQHRAKALCASCPVKLECLSFALDNRIEHGIWGGATERDRRALLRRRPAVASWRTMLETARAEHNQRARAVDDCTIGLAATG
ncbi:WhiB family transcriptional regulator [Streptomyces aureus]